MAKSNRSGEHDIAFAAMKYLDTLPNSSATTSEVKANVPHFFDLTDEDRRQSDTRENEELWQQVVGNVVSHRHDSPDNFINRGLIDYHSGMWTLTKAGKKRLSKYNA